MGKKYIKIAARTVFAGVAIFLFTHALSFFSASIETSSMEALWSATTSDTKVLFIGIILAGLLAS